MLDRLSEDFRFYQQAIGLREERQRVLASNIANADTPGYRARDFDFKAAMQGAIEKSNMRLPAPELALTSARHIPGAGNASSLSPSVDLKYRLPYQASMDGNTVDMDVERVQFADNTMHYQSSLQILSGRIRGMTAAVQE